MRTSRSFVLNFNVIFINKNMDKRTPFVFKSKRSRSENWLDDDKHLLMELVKTRVNDLENKSTDTSTNTRKLAAWVDLQGIFNSRCKGGARTVQQLKSQWKIIKMKLRHKNGSIFKNGNGTLIGSDISSWLPNEHFVDVNEQHSDNISDSNDREPSPHHFKVECINTEETEPDIVSMEEDSIVEVPEQSCKREALRTIPKRTFYTVKPAAHLETSPKKILLKEKLNRQQKTLSNYSAKIANAEIACRMELHQVQMDNEKRKAKNLELKEMLLKTKIEYYRNKKFHDN